MLKKILTIILIVLCVGFAPMKASANSSLESDVSLYNEEYKTELKVDVSKLADGTWKIFFEIHAQIAKLFILIIFASTALGILIMVFSRKNKALYKTGFITFVIVIPMILVVIVFGVPQLYRIFLI